MAEKQCKQRQGIEGLISDELGPVLHGAPSSNLLDSHGHACQNSPKQQNYKEDFSSDNYNFGDVVEEVSDAVVLGAESKLFLLRHWKERAIEVELQF